jgi:3-oxoacyl-(acyl-carrier-protein) synthase
MEAYRSRVAGQVLGFDPNEHLPGAHPDRVDRYAQFALVAMKEAIEDPSRLLFDL